MLSYRHSFHAGNFADVIKHVVLIEILEHLCRKQTPFDYIDTHAGAGLYDLQSEHATQLLEYRAGIGRLMTGDWPELENYLRILARHNAPGALDVYPGSPIIARHFLRAKDRAWLFELHPADFAALQQNTAGDSRIRVMREDGFAGLLRLVPPVSRRALVLVDPSYEIKSDFERVVATIVEAWRKFPTGIYAAWYPVVERQRVDEFEQAFTGSGIRKIQRFELGVTADSAVRGLTGAGMIVINPPWPLMEKMSLLLPRLAVALGRDDGAFFRADTLVDE